MLKCDRCPAALGYDGGSVLSTVLMVATAYYDDEAGAVLCAACAEETDQSTSLRLLRGEIAYHEIGAA
jgi:hypothetical protein